MNKNYTVSFLISLMIVIIINAADRPNFLWLSAEDINTDLGCYGHPDAITPSLDSFAQQGMTYLNCWSVAPSCAPARTSLITGVYPTSCGAQHMRSDVRGSAAIRMFSSLLREAGYYCTVNGKLDYNLHGYDNVWEHSSGKAHWRNCPADKPFFAVFNFTVSHESRINRAPSPEVHDPQKLSLPPIHPDQPAFRRDWATYHDNITEMDRQFAAKLRELEEDGLSDDTIVFFFGDNGGGMPAYKHSGNQRGLHVPLIINVPERWRDRAGPGYRAGSKSERLVSFVDFAPTMLSLADVAVPEWMQGSAFLGRYQGAPHEYIFGFRDRGGSRVDRVRVVRDARYLYVRNYLPHQSAGRCALYGGTPKSMTVWEKLFKDGNLPPEQSSYWQPRQPEELYDLSVDPHCLKNLVVSGSPHDHVLRFRTVLRSHILDVRDSGFLAESEMHLKSAGQAPYDMVRDEQHYPLARVLDMVDIIHAKPADLVKKCRAGLKDSDSSVRYWASANLLASGRNSVEQSEAGLLAALSDVSPAVRVISAHALIAYGGPETRDAAFTTLAAALDYDKHGIFLCQEALNALEILSNQVDSQLILSALQALPQGCRKEDARSGQAMGWMRNHLINMIEVYCRAGAPPAANGR
jgi:arylsulfatase A-like enzyme